VTAPALLLQPSPASGRPACSWCSRRLDRFEALKGARTCSRKCRQATFRLRELALEHGADRLPSPGPRLRVSYNDPPYPTLAKRYYRDQPTYAGEVDHPALIATLEARRARGDLAGWALSTSVRALRDLLPLCPPEARVASWVKPIGARAGTLGIHNVWEPLIVVPGRRLRPPAGTCWSRSPPATAVTCPGGSRWPSARGCSASSAWSPATSSRTPSRVRASSAGPGRSCRGRPRESRNIAIIHMAVFRPLERPATPLLEDPATPSRPVAHRRRRPTAGVLACESPPPRGPGDSSWPSCPPHARINH
jgi:hypothetical protein